MNNGLFKPSSTEIFLPKSNRLKPLLYSDFFLKKKLQEQLKKQNPSNRNIVLSASQYCLAKYFPKFYKRLELHSKPDWITQNKIKQVKTLNHLKITTKRENPYSSQAKMIKILMKLLQNKRKNMKSIPSVNNQLSLELGIFLPRIRILNLTSKWEYGLFNRDNQLRDPERKVWRFYKRFWIGFRNVKHVKMYEYDHDLFFVVQDINKYNKKLSSLKTFILTLENSNYEYYLENLKGKFMNQLSNLGLLNSSLQINLKKENFLYFAPYAISFLLFYSTALCLTVRIQSDGKKQEYAEITQNSSGTLTVRIFPQFFTNEADFPKVLFQIVSQAISYHGKLSRCHKPSRIRGFVLNLENTFNEHFLSLILKELLNIESLVLKFSFQSDSRGLYYQLAPKLALTHLKSLKNLTILDKSPEGYKSIIFNLEFALEKILPLSQFASLHIDCLIQGAPSLNEFLSIFLADQQEQKKINLSRLSFSSFQSLAEFFQALNKYKSLAEYKDSFKVHLRVNRTVDMLQDFEYSLTLQQRIPIELIIDSRADSTVPSVLSPKIVELLQTTFPQFKVTNQSSSNIFYLKN